MPGATFALTCGVKGKERGLGGAVECIGQGLGFRAPGATSALACAVKGDWEALWSALARDHHHAGLVWNETTRGELRLALQVLTPPEIRRLVLHCLDECVSKHPCLASQMPSNAGAREAAPYGRDPPPSCMCDPAANQASAPGAALLGRDSPP